MKPEEHMASAARAIASARLLLADYTGEAVDADHAALAIREAAAFVAAVQRAFVPRTGMEDDGGSGQ